MPTLAQSTDRWLSSRYLPWAAVLIATVLCLPSLRLGWLSDDYAHQLAIRGLPDREQPIPSPLLLFSFVTGQERTQELLDVGMLPWWTYDGLRLAFCRVLSAATHWLDYQLWPNSPALMHAHSLLWFALLVAVVAVLYRDIMGATWMAGLAALLYAIDDAHAMPAAWIANRNGVIASALGMLAVLIHHRWRGRNWSPGALLGPLCLIAALLAGEMAVGAIGYLLAYALFLEPGSRRRKLGSLLPAAVACAGWAVFYFAAGFGAHGSWWYIDPLRNPFNFARAVLERGPILLAGQWFIIPADISLMASPAMVAGQWVIGVLVGLGLIALFWRLIRQDRIARFWAVGMILALLPACATVPFDRLLILVGVGAMGLLAQLLAHASCHSRLIRRVLPCGNVGNRAITANPLIRVGMVGLFAIHALLAPVALPIRIAGMKSTGPFIQRIAASLPNDASSAGKTVVMVNGPSAMMGGFYLIILHALETGQMPPHTWTLASSLAEVEVTRTDDRTLLVRPVGGWMPTPGSKLSPDHEPAPLNILYVLQHLDRLIRDQHHPMRVGQQVTLDGMTVSVEEVTPDGRPAAVSFTFEQSLDSPIYLWLAWDNDSSAYRTFTPPPPGTTTRLPAPEIRF